MRRAVFLDRDGVLCLPALDASTGKYEAPRKPADMALYPYVTKCLLELQTAGYYLFLVSNQPDYAKGKASLEDLKKTHERFDALLKADGVAFKEYYYCYHHPYGAVQGYSYDCECRKPKPFFLFKAAKDFKVDLANSWMVGDRDTDIECGKNAGVRTILVCEPHSADRRGRSNPDYMVRDLEEAIKIIFS